VIIFKKVTKIYPPNPPGGAPTVALEDVSFEIKEREFVSMVGKSGAGKTTLLKLILAQEKPTRGQILFDSQDINKIKPEKIPEFRQRIGAIFQDYKLLASKTTYENTVYVMKVLGKSDEEILRDVPKVLDIVGLSHRSHNFPAELSAGERQRAAIARALIHRPKIILADEPTGNLDPYNTSEIIRLLLKINEFGTTVVLATHDREIVNSLDKRVITLEKGRIVRDENRGRFIL
jgi:cell division transport system ATP-binding protein